MCIVTRKLFGGKVWCIGINRPMIRNAVDRRTANLLRSAFVAFDKDTLSCAAVLYGEGDHFCAGADLKAIASSDDSSRNCTTELGPMGPTGLTLSKPVVAAVEGFAVAGGLELAVWCDLRVAAVDAVFGVYCRRFGVPLIDGGTVRLPRLIGHSRAMDMILTGRGVTGEEALGFGLANRLVARGTALEESIRLCEQMCAFPQECLRNDRLSAISQWGKELPKALEDELFVYGRKTMEHHDLSKGAKQFLTSKPRP